MPPGCIQRAEEMILMKRAWLYSIGAICLTALWSSPAWGSIPPQPGVINYVEGQAAVGGQALNPNSVGTVKLAAGQSLTTNDTGRAEILLTPGVLLRVAHNSSVQMVSPGIENTVVMLQKGRALVEADQIYSANNIRINENGSSTELLKPGLYEFDADHNQIRVFDGIADVHIGAKVVEVRGGHQVAFDARKPKARRFDKKANEDDFYRWASLRSSYLAEANIDTARNYENRAAAYAGPGLYAAPYAYGGWGTGWYWDPWFGAYTFMPADGILYSPFGWGFYSPYFAFGAPYLGYGSGFYHHFGPGYHPAVGANVHAQGFSGHSFSGHAVGGSGFRGGAVVGGGFHGGFAGGGLHGGGFAGGGFHGGGGGGRR